MFVFGFDNSSLFMLTMLIFFLFVLGGSCGGFGEISDSFLLFRDGGLCGT